jgi:hypothetical protein
MDSDEMNTPRTARQGVDHGLPPHRPPGARPVPVGSAVTGEASKVALNATIAIAVPQSRADSVRDIWFLLLLMSYVSFGTVSERSCENF